jgi:serine carboxypeptidase-like clade 2
MYLNPYRWNKKASVLYLESPGAVGFSKASKDYLIQNDTSVARDNLVALIQFFTKYSQYQGNEFYIAGEGYAGIYIPQLAQKILDYNQQRQ